MSFLDEVKDKVVSAIGSMKGENAGLIDSVMGMVTDKESANFS